MCHAIQHEAVVCPQPQASLTARKLDLKNMREHETERFEEHIQSRVECLAGILRTALSRRGLISTSQIIMKTLEIG